MENGRVSQKISLRPKNSDRRSVVQTSIPESPKSKDGIIRMFFGERSLLFLGVFASILSLSMALWSIHRNSDNTRRLNSLNSSIVDLLVKQKAAPVVEVGRREISREGGSRLDMFREKRDARKQERPPPDILQETVKDIEAQNKEKEREHASMLERIRKESDENIRKMELASQEAIAEGSRHRLSTRQLSDRISKLQIRPPTSEDTPYEGGVEKIFESITKMGDQLIPNVSNTTFSEDIDVEDLERDLRLLISDR